MAWDDPLGDLLAAAAAYRGPKPAAPNLMVTNGEYERALELAGGDPDAVDAEARRLGFAGIERYNSELGMTP